MIEAIKSPSMLLHYIELKHAQNSMNRAQNSYEHSKSQLTLAPLPSSLKSINDSNKWIFSFFSADLEKNLFVCRLWHKYKAFGVCPEVFFKDGTLIINRLLLHLRASHNIDDEFGLTSNSYVDANSGKVIELDSMPLTTMELIKKLLDTSKFANNNNVVPEITSSGEVENSSLENDNEDLRKCVKQLNMYSFKTLCFFNPIGTEEVICRLHHPLPAVIRCIDKNKKQFTLQKMKSHMCGNHGIRETMLIKNDFAITSDGVISLTKMVIFKIVKNSF